MSETTTVPSSARVMKPASNAASRCGPKKETVEHVEALGVALAVGPRLDVARAEQVRNGEARDRAATVPVLQQTATEDVLADPLNHQAFGFRRARQGLGLRLEDVQQLVRQGARELERPAQQPMEGGDSETLRAPAAPLGRGLVNTTPSPASASSTSARDVATRNKDSPTAVSQIRIDVWLLPKWSRSAARPRSRSKPLSVAAFSRRVMVIGVSITGLPRAARFGLSAVRRCMVLGGFGRRP